MQNNYLMLQTILNWFKRNFSDPEALGLFFFLVIGFLLFEFFGKFLLPVLISIVIAYLLEGMVQWLENFHFPRILAVWIIYSMFIGLLLIVVFAFLPLLWRQLTNLILEIPAAIGHSQNWINQLAKQYPNVITADTVNHVVVLVKDQSSRVGRAVLTRSLASISGILEAVIYLVLVPLLVFFFLKDGKKMAQWTSRFLPSNRGLIRTVWKDLDQKIGAYVRGRVIEMILVAFVSVIAFSFLQIQYAFLLGMVVGFSVIVPYIGAILVTIPIFIIGLMQWGISAHFGYLLLVYGIIIALDANVLFPLLFSETMDLHPIVIILSVLFFGGIWGFWGVFFAIPLASLVKAILNAWPQAKPT